MPNVQQQQEAIKKSNENEKTQNIKVTMEKYIIDWVKLSISRTKYVKTQSSKYLVCRDQIDVRNSIFFRLDRWFISHPIHHHRVHLLKYEG